MQRLEVSGAVRTIYGSLGVERLKVKVKVKVLNCRPEHAIRTPRF